MSNAEKVFAALKAAVRFPRREMLTVAEVARALPVCSEQVLCYIAAGELAAVETASGKGHSRTANGRPRARFWRVPAVAWDTFIDQRRSDLLRGGARPSKMPVVTSGGIGTAPKARKTPRSLKKAPVRPHGARKGENGHSRAVQPGCRAIRIESRQSLTLASVSQAGRPTLEGNRNGRG